MQQQKQPISTKTQQKKYDEQVLVVKTTTLFPDGLPQGLITADFNAYYQRIVESAEYIPRSLAETDPSYKQIIPYLVFSHEDTYFLMQRKATSSETRLKNKYTLGIGGHIRKEDMSSGESIIDWAHREFHEEVAFDGEYDIEPLGLINDERDAVGQVHTGFVFVLQGKSNNISVRSELQSGALCSLEHCRGLYESMESWSQLVLESLLQKE